MMKLSPQIYKKYTQAGPNYQCYPTKLNFHKHVTKQNIIDRLHKLKHNEFNLQLYFPLCQDPDCHATTLQVQLNQDAQLSRYIELIEKETLIYKQYLNQAKLREIYFSGNEVSLLGVKRLRHLLNMIAKSFAVNFTAVDLLLDINARLFDLNSLESIKNLGFNKLKVSTLNFNHQLHLGADKVQSYQAVDQLIQATKNTHFKSLQIELIYGLPNESCDDIKRTLNALINMRCEHICLTRYLHRPYFFKRQKMLIQDHISANKENYLTYQMCLDTLSSAGYKHLGMNCFVNINSELHDAADNNQLNYNHTGYTLNGINDVVSLGASSISKIDGFFYQNHVDIEDYSQSLDRGIFPAAKGCHLNSDHMFRTAIIKSLIINHRFEFNQHEIQFNDLEYLKDTYEHLHAMEKDGLVQLSKHSIEVTELGCYFLKNICALFDLNMRELIAYSMS
jgi:oxygen-independent coproporphyrinogen-3 oxidase